MKKRLGAAAIAATSCILIAVPAQAATITPVLRIDATTSPVRVDVPYTITVTPAAKAKGKKARIQVKGIAAWTGFDTFRIPASGRITDDVEGYQPGVGRYRVVILSKTGRIIAKSAVVSVTWTPRTG